MNAALEEDRHLSARHRIFRAVSGATTAASDSAKRKILDERECEVILRYVGETKREAVDVIRNTIIVVIRVAYITFAIRIVVFLICICQRGAVVVDIRDSVTVAIGGVHGHLQIVRATRVSVGHLQPQDKNTFYIWRNRSAGRA